MAIKSFYKQTLKGKKFEVEYTEEHGGIWIRKPSNNYHFFGGSNSLYIRPEEFKQIKELIEQLDVMQGKL